MERNWQRSDLVSVLWKGARGAMGKKRHFRDRPAAGCRHLAGGRRQRRCGRRGGASDAPGPGREGRGAPLTTGPSAPRR